MTHPDALLSAHLDGELTPEEAGRVEAHLVECGECRAAVTALGRIRSAVRSLPVLDPPGGTVMSMRDRSRWVWAASGIAAAALALAVGLVVAPGEQTKPIDLDMMADRHTARFVLDPGISAIRGPVEGR